MFQSRYGVQAEKARMLFQLNKISREEARRLVEPFVEEFNEKSVKIAMKYNQKPKTINYSQFLRSGIFL